MVLLLEDLERSDLAALWNDVNVPFVVDPDSPLMPTLEFAVCPSSSSSMAVPGPTNYVANAGFMPPSNESGPLLAAQRRSNGIFLDQIVGPPLYPRKPEQVRGSDIRDGMSNTILLSENLLATSWWSFGPLNPTHTTFLGLGLSVAPNQRFGNTFVWLYANESIGGVRPEMRINGRKTELPPGTPLTMYLARPSAYHPQGVNVVFADGNTRFLGDQVAYHVYQQLMTPHGASSDMPDRTYVLDSDDF